MATIDETLLSLESELKGMIDQTASLKQKVGDYSKAREDLTATRVVLEKATLSLDVVLRKEEELLVAIRQSMPDKVVDQLSKFNSLSDGLKKEIVCLEEEFISTKDVMLHSFGQTESKLRDQNDNIKSAIIKSVAELYEKYQFMSEKLYLADEKIIMSQDHVFDNSKRIEESQEKTGKQILESVQHLNKDMASLSKISQRNFLIIVAIVLVNFSLAGYFIYRIIFQK